MGLDKQRVEGSINISVATAPFEPNYKRQPPFGFSFRLKPIGSLPFAFLAKAALQIFNVHDLKVVAI
jgi:hypothetical protein